MEVGMDRGGWRVLTKAPPAGPKHLHVVLWVLHCLATDWMTELKFISVNDFERARSRSLNGFTSCQNRLHSAVNEKHSTSRPDICAFPFFSRAQTLFKVSCPHWLILNVNHVHLRWWILYKSCRRLIKTSFDTGHKCSSRTPLLLWLSRQRRFRIIASPNSDLMLSNRVVWGWNQRTARRRLSLSGANNQTIRGGQKIKRRHRRHNLTNTKDCGRHRGGKNSTLLTVRDHRDARDLCVSACVCTCVRNIFCVCVRARLLFLVFYILCVLVMTCKNVYALRLFWFQLALTR